jgi:hypothetical protein
MCIPFNAGYRWDCSTVGVTQTRKQNYVKVVTFISLLVSYFKMAPDDQSCCIKCLK